MIWILARIHNISKMKKKIQNRPYRPYTVRAQPLAGHAHSFQAANNR